MNNTELLKARDLAQRRQLSEAAKIMRRLRKNPHLVGHNGGRPQGGGYVTYAVLRSLQQHGQRFSREILTDTGLAKNSVLRALNRMTGYGWLLAERDTKLGNRYSLTKTGKKKLLEIKEKQP